MSRLLVALVLLLGADWSMAQDPDPKAVEHYRTGYDLIKAQNFRNAAIELTKATEADPNYGPPFYALGQAYKALNDYPKAIKAFEKAYELGVKKERIPTELATLYHQDGVKSYQKRKYKEAISSLEKSLQHNPKNAKAHYAIGLCYSQLRDSEGAKKAYQNAAKVDPSFIKSYKALGDIYRQNREYGPAAETYEKAIKIDPKFADAYGGLALTQIASQDLEKAVTTLNQAIEVRPKYANGHIILGSALNQLGRYHEAVAPLNKAIDIDGKNAEAHYRLAEAHYGTGDNRKAIESGLKAVRQKRSYYAAQVILGDAYGKLGQVQEARTWYSKAAKDSRYKDYCTHRLQELDRSK